MHCFDFPALVGIVGALQFQFQVRQNTEQRVVDPVCRAQSQLGERGIFFVFGELRLKLEFLLVQLTIFMQPAKEFFLRLVALPLQTLVQFGRFFQDFANSFPFPALKLPHHEHHHQGNKSQPGENNGITPESSSCISVRENAKSSGFHPKRLVPPTTANSSIYNMKRILCWPQ